VASVQQRCEVPHLRSFVAEEFHRDFYRDDTFKSDVVQFNHARMAAATLDRPIGVNTGSTTTR